MKLARLLGVTSSSLVLLFSLPVDATPYASGVTNDAGTVSFILNESADSVKVTFNNNTQTNDLGALAAGTHSFSLGVATNFQIQVSKASAPGFVRQSATNAAVLAISSDSNPLLNYNSLRGLAINKDPKSPYFGRIYVANSVAGSTSNAVVRSVGDGIFMLNADQTDALDMGDVGRDGGLPLGSSTEGPYRISLGPDGSVYICDWSDAYGNLYVTDPDVTAGSHALKALVGTAVIPLTTANNHGSVAAVHVAGSIAGGNLQIWTIDEDMQANRDTTSKTQMNSLWRYDVNGGSLPFEGDPTRVWSSTIANKDGYPAASQTMDMERGPDGRFYITTYRSNGAESGLIVRSSTGGSTQFNSYNASVALVGGTKDILHGARGVSVSPDQRYVAVVRENSHVWIIPLISGVPDLSRRLHLAAMGASNVGRAIKFDAAGNLYVASSGRQLVRILSPGGTTLAVTGGDASGTNGTFKLVTAPVIREQPASVTTYAGSNATFIVFVEGIGTAPTYQWKLNGTNISGANASTYTRSNVQQATAGNYTVTISNELAVVTSDVALLTVNDGLPIFTTQAADRTVEAGTNTTFTAATVGTDPRFYQWQLNGIDILGATNLTFTRTNAQQDTAGAYTLIASNSFGAVTSTVANLTVIDIPPTFTTALANRTQNAGTTYTWSPVIRGTDPRTYQWYFNGGEITDATNMTYSITNVQQVHAGEYSIVANNDYGTASSYAMLTVTDTAPVITTQPANITVNEGSNAVFSVVTRGTDPRAYQWQMNGADILDATDSTYTLLNAHRTQHSNTFNVIINNDYGSVTSSVRTLTVNFQPEITVQPESQQAEPGTNVTFTVGAIGNSLKYQWLFNGTDISGATTSTYTKANVQLVDAGSYSVVITNTAGLITSSDAVLTVNSGVAEPPFIGIIGANGDVTLSWTAIDGRTYRVQYKAALSDASWTDLVPDVTAAGTSANKSDNVGTDTQRYYRVLLLPE